VMVASRPRISFDQKVAPVLEIVDWYLCALYIYMCIQKAEDKLTTFAWSETLMGVATTNVFVIARVHSLYGFEIGNMDLHIFVCRKGSGWETFVFPGKRLQEVGHRCQHECG
jgi:hypothetical protein